MKNLTWEQFCDCCKRGYLLDEAKSGSKAYFYIPEVVEEKDKIVVKLEGYDYVFSEKNNPNLNDLGRTLKLVSNCKCDFYFVFLKVVDSADLLN